MKNLSLAQSLRKEEIQSKHGSLAGLRRGRRPHHEVASHSAGVSVARSPLKAFPKRWSGAAAAAPLSSTFLIGIFFYVGQTMQVDGLGKNRFHDDNSTRKPSLLYMKISCTTGPNGNCPLASPSLSLFFYDESVVVGSSGHPGPMPPPPFVAVHMNFYCGLCLLPRSCPCWVRDYLCTAHEKCLCCLFWSSLAYKSAVQISTMLMCLKTRV